MTAGTLTTSAANGKIIDDTLPNSLSTRKEAPEMEWNPSDTAVVFIDPQNDVLSPTGINWPATGASVTENDTVAHMLAIFQAAQAASFPMFISPHYFYPTDHRWLFNGALEADELRTGTFDRSGPLNLDGLAGSGADWLEEFRPYINGPGTVWLRWSFGEDFVKAVWSKPIGDSIRSAR